MDNVEENIVAIGKIIRSSRRLTANNWPAIDTQKSRYFVITELNNYFFFFIKHMTELGCGLIRI